QSRALFPVAAPGGDGSRRNRLGGADGAGAVVPGDAVSCLACRQARSRRSAAVRMMAQDVPLLELRAVDRRYDEGERKLVILDGAEFSMARGETVALIAPSGAGKSTLLHTAGLLEHPDGGDVFLNGRACGALSDDDRTAIRRNEIGFVYQFHHLLPEFSALENIMMPQLVRGLAENDARERARQLLDYMKIGPRAEHRPAELSGGEQQRVAIARAVANAPLLLLAD